MGSGWNVMKITRQSGATPSREPAAEPNEQQISGWVMRADTKLGKEGCSGQYGTYKQYSNGSQQNKETCIPMCKSGKFKFAQFHESGFCGCFSDCDFERKASTYGSKAEVWGIKESTPTPKPVTPTPKPV